MAAERYISPVPDQAALSAAVVGALRERLPTWTADESDPGVYWSDDTAGRLIRLINDFNDSADANDVLRAQGLALRELVRQFGVLTPPEGASDDDLRAIFQAQWDAVTEGTPAWDIRQALKSSTRVADASRSPVDWAANTVTMYVVDANGGNLTDEERAGVSSFLNDPARPTFWLDYLVPEATVENYLLSGRIVYDRSKADPLEQVVENLQAAMDGLRTLRTGIDDSILQQAAWVPDVVTRMELVFNSITTDAQGNAFAGPVVPSFAPAINVVRHGSISAEIGLDPDTRMLIGRAGSTGVAIGGRELRETFPGGGGANTITSFTYNSAQSGEYTWVQIDAVGEFSNAAIHQEASRSTQPIDIPLTQIAQSDTQTLFRSTTAIGVAYRQNSNIVFTATRRWPPITSGTDW